MAGAVFGWLLLALAATDLSAMLLPNPLTGRPGFEWTWVRLLWTVTANF